MAVGPLLEHGERASRLGCSRCVRNPASSRRPPELQSWTLVLRNTDIEPQSFITPRRGFGQPLPLTTVHPERARGTLSAAEGE